MEPLTLMVRGYVTTYTKADGWTSTEAGIARRLNDLGVTPEGANSADALGIAKKEYGAEHVRLYAAVLAEAAALLAEAAAASPGIDAPAANG